MRIKSLAVSGIALITLGGALAGCKSSGSDAAAPAATKVTSAAAAPTASAAADNGIAKLTADEIVTKTKGALKDAKSFRAKGNTTTDGQKLGLEMEVSGTDVLGKLSIGAAVVELLSVGGKQYMKPNAAFWTSVAGLKPEAAKTVISQVGNRWIAVTKNSGMNSFFEAVKVDEILKPDGKVTKGTAKQIGDYPTIGVKDSKGGVLYVATTGEPYPIEIDGGADGGFTFSDFGKTFSDLKAPAAADVKNLNI